MLLRWFLMFWGDIVVAYVVIALSLIGLEYWWHEDAIRSGFFLVDMLFSWGMGYLLGRTA